VCVFFLDIVHMFRYRLSEHDHGIAAVSFSHDEKLLCTVGAAADNKIFIWDMSNGYIVTVI
jgi:cilia- and flagella-associated protein 52